MKISALIGREIWRWRKLLLNRFLASLLGQLLRNVICLLVTSPVIISRPWFVHSTKEWGQEDAAPQNLLYFQIKRLINALTTDDSRKGRQLSHKWELRTELHRSRQEAVAGKAYDCSVLHGLGYWISSRLREGAWGRNYPNETQNFYVLFEMRLGGLQPQEPRHCLP